MSAPPEISVIICTRNRSGWLRRAITSVCEGESSGVGFELIVVDGNSTDDTRGTTEALRENYPQVRYTNCPERGLPKARVFGAAQARGRVVGYLDDDAVACPGWLPLAAAIARERNPICFGGPFTAFYDDPKPAWFLDAYGSFSHGDEERALSDDEFLCGGNIFFRREALEACGGFDPEFVDAHEAYAYGEETVAQVRLRKTFPGEKFFYHPRLAIGHLVRPERMTLRAQCREAYELGRGYGRLVAKEQEGSRWFPFYRRMVGCRVRFLTASAVGWVWRDRQRFPYAKQYIIDQAHHELRGAGMFRELSKAAAQRGSSVGN